MKVFSRYFGHLLLILSVVFLGSVLLYNSDQHVTRCPAPLTEATPPVGEKPDVRHPRFTPPQTAEERSDLARLRTLIETHADELPNRNQPPTSAFQETMIELRTGRITWQQALADITPTEVPEKEETQ